jgi:hypothetical protein
MADSDVLRQHLGERIPAGGTDADTFFSDDEITELLNTADSEILVAAAEGWLMKASEYAALVNVSEGGGRQDLSDMHKHAMELAKHYQELSGGAVSSRTVMSKLATRE